MVNYLLMICADLENLTNLEPHDGCDDLNFSYLFKSFMVKCGCCGELSQKETCVSLGDTVPNSSGKGTTNLIQKVISLSLSLCKCKFCGRDGTVTMIKGRGKPLTQEASQSGKYCPVMLFDCRGFEPVDFIFGDGWKVESYAVLVIQEHYQYMCAIVCYLDANRKILGNHGNIAGTKYEGIDLSNGDFAEYDEKGECPVMISNLRSKFDVVK
ncbi:hypothetical protein EZV62_013307 [Acer yangbiense]|uniref:Uncharacterized protein n=1 Tax=Acer yangbiense TaxID=1000413 RepID=A0A5C7HYU6_9ROSI|nr:hypothetical protein EZV62_013307 [Acer yangbiense]